MLLIFFLSAKYHNKLFYLKNKLFICLEMPQVKFKRMHSIFFHSEDDLDLDNEVLIPTSLLYEKLCFFREISFTKFLKSLEFQIS